jgi:hypothetical protein
LHHPVSKTIVLLWKFERHCKSSKMSKFKSVTNRPHLWNSKIAQTIDQNVSWPLQSNAPNPHIAFMTPWCHVMLLASFVYATRDSLDVIMPFIVNTRSLNGTSYMSYSKIYKTLGEAVLADVPYKVGITCHD